MKTFKELLDTIFTLNVNLFNEGYNFVTDFISKAPNKVNAIKEIETYIEGATFLDSYGEFEKGMEKAKAEHA